MVRVKIIASQPSSRQDLCSKGCQPCRPTAESDQHAALLRDGERKPRLLHHTYSRLCGGPIIQDPNYTPLAADASFQTTRLPKFRLPAAARVSAFNSGKMVGLLYRTLRTKKDCPECLYGLTAVRFPFGQFWTVRTVIIRICPAWLYPQWI